MRICYVCYKAVGEDHECEVAAKLAEHPVDLQAPYLTAAAIPTRTGPEQ